MELTPWEDYSPWHPRRYRRNQFPMDIFDDSRRMEREMENMKREMGNMMSSLDRGGLSNWGTTGGLGGGGIGGGDFFGGGSLEHFVEGDQNTPGKYLMNIPLGRNIGPHDLKVTLKDNFMTIEAKKDRKSDDGTCRVYQEFSRKFTLPPNVNSKEVKTVLTPDGFLKVEAPLPLKSIEHKPTDIPIKHHQ